MNTNEDSIEHTDHKVAIRIDNLKVWTTEEKSWWKRRVTKQKILILNNVKGCIKQGEFAAIIGPSGAGKTTFLVSLAGKCTLPSEGEVMINGANASSLEVVELVPQFEVFIDSLSVMEHLLFMIEMKRGDSTEHHNQLILETLLCELKLKALENSAIGSLSGGEKRLLSLATSLLSNPHILICDEPTTGLDSYNATLVISALKKLTQTGKIVICSVHQPSCDIFKEFSSILLMANGELLFHGTQDECKNVFESINLHCPLNYNPAEFYIRAVSNHSEKYVEKIMENYHYRLAQSLDRQTCSGSDSMGQFKLTKRNWFKQVQLILWRLSLTLKREIKSHIFQLFLSVMVSALVLGTCYVGVTGTTQRGVQDIRGFLWLITSEVCFSLSYNALYVFEYEMALFKREVGVYRCSAYFVARFLSFIPRCIVWPVTLVALSTFAVELPNHVVTSLEFMLALMVAGVASLAYGLGMVARFISTGITGDVMPTCLCLSCLAPSLILLHTEAVAPLSNEAIPNNPGQMSWYFMTFFTYSLVLPSFLPVLLSSGSFSEHGGLGMGALFTSTGIMGDVMPCADLPLFLMSGAFLRISSMPAWLYPVKFLSHFYYGLDAVSNIYWRQIGSIDCPWNSTTICIKDGPSVLVENGYSQDFLFQDGLGLLVVTILWGLLGYYGLKREEKKGYAY